GFTVRQGRDMALEKLKPLQVAKHKARGLLSDGGGLYLQVAKDGSKSWVFRFRRLGSGTSPGGPRDRYMGLGPVGTVGLDEARAKARECRLLLLDGVDPIEHRKAELAAKAVERAKAMTFDECREAYIRAHSPGWRNAKHGKQWTTTLATYASPVIGAL